MDIAAEGATPMEAIQSLVDVTNVQITAAIEEGDLASLFSPAPSELWRLFWLAKERPVRSLPRKSVKPVNRLRFREWATA